MATNLGTHVIYAKYLTDKHEIVCAICALYEVTGINHVTRRTVHRQQQ